MFTRSLRLGRARQRRHYTRNDIRPPTRNLKPGALGNEQSVSMQPHPYSPATGSSELSSLPSQDPPPNTSSSSSNFTPPPGQPATPSEEPKENSTGLTIITSPNRINAEAPSIDDQAPSRLSNPFDTHKVFRQLEKEFPSPIAHTLMRAARGLLIDRIAKARREGVDVKEVENEQYLYRAALSELKTELAMRTKKESAALQQSTGAIKKDVEALSSRMKEDIATMKHEVQMELNNRKNEVKAEAKMRSIAIEELIHKATVKVSDLRTEVEQGKWDNTRRGVAVIGTFVLFVIFSLEMAPKPPQLKPKPKPKFDEHHDHSQTKAPNPSRAVSSPGAPTHPSYSQGALGAANNNDTELWRKVS